FLAGFTIDRADESADAQVAARDADDDLVFDDDRRMRDGVLLRRLLADLLDHVIPENAAGLRVDGDQMRVDRAHVERVAENRETAADAAAAWARFEQRLVLDMPERPARDRIERDHFVDALRGRALQHVAAAVG